MKRAVILFMILAVLFSVGVYAQNQAAPSAPAVPINAPETTVSSAPVNVQVQTPPASQTQPAVPEAPVPQTQAPSPNLWESFKGFITWLADQEQSFFNWFKGGSPGSTATPPPAPPGPAAGDLTAKINYCTGENEPYLGGSEYLSNMRACLISRGVDKNYANSWNPTQ